MHDGLSIYFGCDHDSQQACSQEVISLLDYRKGFGHTEEIRV